MAFNDFAKCRINVVVPLSRQIIPEEDLETGEYAFAAEIPHPAPRLIDLGID